QPAQYLAVELDRRHRLAVALTLPEARMAIARGVSALEHDLVLFSARHLLPHLWGRATWSKPAPLLRSTTPHTPLRGGGGAVDGASRSAPRCSTFLLHL